MFVLTVLFLISALVAVALVSQAAPKAQPVKIDTRDRVQRQARRRAGRF